MHRDPKSTPENPVWWRVDVAFRKKLASPVTLEQVKAERSLSKMALVRIPRLSVQPVTLKEWARVLAMSRPTRATGHLK
jgi:predicted RNA-binding protein with PUA-like domain